MFGALANAFKIPELKKKIFFTLAVIALYRVGAFIPTPGINGERLAQFFASLAGTGGGTIFGIMNLFSGGAVERLTIFALGIMPFITASIIMQLMIPVIPSLEKLVKEGGEQARRTVTQYSRYLTLGLSIIQSFFIALWLENPTLFGGLQIVDFPGWPFRLLTVLTLTSGSVLIMYLGEQITERGIGNGASILITAGIVSRLPIAVYQLVTLASSKMHSSQIEILKLLFLMVVLVIAIVAVVQLIQGERKIPVQYARRMVGRKMYGGQTTHIPLKVNQANVIPIIFAQSLLVFPATIAGLVQSQMLQQVAQSLLHGKVLYNVLYVLLIIFFSFFYTALTFNPVDIADNIKKYGGFIPGIRPGKPTAEYLDFIMVRITLAGAIFLALVAIVPDLIGAWLQIPYSITAFFGGTSLLIVVGVMLDTIRKIESQLLLRHYDGFLRSGRVRGRR